MPSRRLFRMRCARRGRSVDGHRPESDSKLLPVWMHSERSRLPTIRSDMLQFSRFRFAQPRSRFGAHRLSHTATPVERANGVY